MEREVILTREPIDEVALSRARRRSTTAGAVISFLGVVRDLEAGGRIQGLDYTAHEAMARHQFGLLMEALAARWPVESVRLVHRLGPVLAGEASLWVEVVAPHRGEAFAACQWLIDEMKRVVPIWKRTIS
jgi:molybdopterin synthase catalytic subunit